MRILREEKFAIVNKDNRVRVLLSDGPAARRVAASLSKNVESLAPYRVVRVEVQEVLESVRVSP